MALYLMTAQTQGVIFFLGALKRIRFLSQTILCFMVPSMSPECPYVSITLQISLTLMEPLLSYRDPRIRTLATHTLLYFEESGWSGLLFLYGTP